MDAMIATIPKNGACAIVMFSRNIRKDPENIPITEPTIPRAISKFLEMILVLLMIMNLIIIIYNYLIKGRQLPEL